MSEVVTKAKFLGTEQLPQKVAKVRVFVRQEKSRAKIKEGLESRPGTGRMICDA